MGYQTEYQSSIKDPAHFWQSQARALPWFKPPFTILSKDKNGVERWFADGELNTSYMALDYHVEQGRGEQDALIYESPVTGTSYRYTYQELLDEVALFAGALKAKGVSKGDRVVIYMPMIPQAVIAMLAVARLGAIHSVVFGGFAPNELAVRIEDATPKVIVTASCGIEGQKTIPYIPLVASAIDYSNHKPQTCIVFQRPQYVADLDSDVFADWTELTESAQPASCVAVKATDPLYILYTSGTTGKPKGVVRDNGGHAVALHYSLKNVYDIEPGDVFWAASDVGWVVGHSYIVYGPLLKGATTLMYEGKPVGTPNAGAFWRVAEQYQVKVLFAAPTAFRAIRKEDPEGLLINEYDLSKLKRIFMAGERLDPPTYEWTVEKTGKPVIDHWWQTETGWPICANPTGLGELPPKAGSSTVPVPGFDVQVLNEEGEALAPNTQGAIAIKRPLPPGCLPTIWGDCDRFKSSYLNQFDGYYTSGDGGYIDEDGYVFIMGRTDDVINVAGHRLSTGEMEEVVAAHPSVAECSVIAIPDALKGQLPVGLVILKDGIVVDEQVLEKELVASVRSKIGPIACFKRAIIVPRLPKTRSGKILRKLLRQLASAEEVVVPSTIDAPECVDEIATLMKDNGLMTS